MENNPKSTAGLRVCAAIEPGDTLKAMSEALSSEPLPLETGTDGKVFETHTHISVEDARATQLTLGFFSPCLRQLR
jgi:hypothetical protein